jgi:Fe-S oxidoreductase
VTRIFAPGCALVLHKPHLADRLLEILREHVGPMERLLTCCHHVPPLAPGTEVINVCPGCDKRYRENYRDASTISLWEVLAENRFFPWPDYGGREMTVIDACPTRDSPRVHRAVRTLLDRMNVAVVEPRLTGTKSTCCGDSFWGRIPTAEVVAQMEKKAASMPAADVVVYCVSCSKAMFVGGRRPRYLIDLLFGEETLAQTCEPDAWHRELEEFIAGPGAATP